MPTLTKVPSGDGSHLEWSASTGPTRWQTVDDSIGSDDADSTYIFLSNTAGGTNTSTFDGFAHTGNPIEVTVVTRCRQAFGSGAEVFPCIVSGGTVYTDTGGVLSFSGSYTTISQAWDTNPATSAAWTWAEIDALQIGVDIVSLTAGQVVRCTQYYISVSHTESSIINETASGGVVCAGSSIPQPQFEFPSGGVVCAGSSQPQGLPASGGAVCGGISTLYINGSQVMPGVGIVAGGEAVSSITFVPSGGLVVAGSTLAGYGFIPSGGVVCGGSAVPGLGAAIDFGGVVCGGTAEVHTLAQPSSSGGVVIGSFFRRAITIPAGAVSADLSGFPLLVRADLDPEHASGVFFSFLDTSRNELPSELINYDVVSGRVYLVVKVDIPAASPTIVYLYY